MPNESPSRTLSEQEPLLLSALSAAGPEAQWAEHEYLIAVSLVEPHYLAYATALHYHGYTERPPDPVTVATTRRKNPVTIEGLTYRFATLTRYKFFGYETVSLLGGDVQMAEREKAIVDGFDHSKLVVCSPNCTRYDPPSYEH
jgi:predicted transcriptional regulator of viral defense system